jgi:hypothetical protein
MQMSRNTSSTQFQKRTTRPTRIDSRWVIATISTLIILGSLPLASIRSAANTIPPAARYQKLVPPRTPRWPAALKPGVRVTYQAGTGYGESGSQSLEQLTITAQTADRLSLDVRTWGLDTVNRRLLNSAIPSAYIVSVNTGNEYWQPPELLAGLPDGEGGGQNVRRLSYPINGRKYNAIRIAGPLGTYTYDLVSGLLLFWSNGSLGGTGVRTTLTRTLLGTRSTRLPWSGESPGAQAKVLRRLELSGSVTLTAQRSTWTTGRTVRWLVKSSDELGFVVKRTDTQDPGTGAPPTVVEDDAFLPLPTVWIDPAILASFRRGQVLDQDPISRGRTTVDVGNGLVSIVDEVQNDRIAAAYDSQSGFLSAVQIEYLLPDFITTTQLRRTV